MASIWDNLDKANKADLEELSDLIDSTKDSIYDADAEISNVIHDLQLMSDSDTKEELLDTIQNAINTLEDVAKELY